MQNTKLQLEKPDWTQVRAIYKKLSDDFHVLTDPYGLEISPDQKLMLDHLILVIDAVDKVVDELPEKDQRDDLTKSIMEFLRAPDSKWDHPLTNALFAKKVSNLKRIVQHADIKPRFLDAAEKIFHYTEVKRHTKSRKELLQYILMEGKATAELPLSIMQAPPDHPFSIFFTRLCSLMGIADLVIDARSDYKLKYITYKPNPGLYLKLNWMLIREGAGIFFSFPKPLRFLVYVLKFSWVLITEKEEMS